MKKLQGLLALRNLLGRLLMRIRGSLRLSCHNLLLLRDRLCTQLRAALRTRTKQYEELATYVLKVTDLEKRICDGSSTMGIRRNLNYFSTEKPHLFTSFANSFGTSGFVVHHSILDSLKRFSLHRRAHVVTSDSIKVDCFICVWTVANLGVSVVSRVCLTP